MICIHKRRVHLNRGRNPHTWICLDCKREIVKPGVFSAEEAEAMAEYLIHLETNFPNKGFKENKENTKMETMQITFNFKEGTKPADIATKLRWQAGLFEGLAPKEAASVKNTSAPAAEESDDDEDFGSKKKSTKERVAAAFESDDDDAGFTDAPPAKKKAKKITLEDVNEACKARAKATGGKEGRAEVLKILKKQFKTESVSSLDEDQYADVIEAMEV